MAAVIAPRALLFLAPHLTLAASFLAAPHYQPFANEYALILKGIACLLLAVSAVLSVYFNRSRVLFSAGMLLLVLVAGIDAPLAVGGADASALAIASVLVPANFVLMSMLRERGILSLQANALYGALALQVVAIVGLNAAFPALLDQILAVRIPWWPAYLATDMPHLVLAMTSLAAMVMLLRALWTRHPIDSALLALLGTFVMVSNGHFSDLQGSLLYALVGLALLLAVIQDFYDMAYRDELTGLGGRRALNEFLLRLGRNYSIAMIDVDHFKRFNDRYGHDTGDQVLRMVGAQLARASGGGKAFRYGGEEFTLVFPRRAPAEVKPHLEALRERIASYPLALRGKTRSRCSKEGRKRRRGKLSAGTTVGVTVSIGLAQRKPEIKFADDVIRAADRALYKAKRGGRNRLCMG